jgi:PAS domain S-box-containing protein
VDEVLTNICGEVKQYMGFNHVAAFLLDDERVKAAAIAEAKSPECPSVLGSTISVQATEIIDQMANPNEPLVLHAPLYSLDPEMQQGEDVQETNTVVVCLPLRFRDKVQGIVCCLGEESPPLEQNLDLLASVVQATAQAVENGLLYGKLATYNKSLMSTVDEQTKLLQHSNDQLEAILNNTHDSILLFHENMTIQTANLAFSKQFGYSLDVAVGLPMTALAAPESIDSLSSVLATMWDGSENHSLEMLGQRQDGSTFDAEVVFVAIPDNDNHVVCTVHDISHLKSVERMKDRFIASVNHELRNPIAGIILSANGLHTHYDSLTDESKLKQIDHIRTQSKILSELTDAILNIARVESRTNNPDREIVDMHAIVDNVITEWRPQIEEKHQHIELACEPIPMLVAGDFSDYARVWRNLISNAVKYTPDEGNISVRLGVLDRNDNGIVESSSSISLNSLPESLPQDEYPYLVGQIEDTGHGMSQEDLDNLFTRFYRGWAHYNSIPGTGLGLSLVREVLNLYGGDITVDSTLGTGSVFTFWLPLKEESES